MRIPEQKVDEIYQAIDIISIAKEYCPDLKRAGSTWKARSPFQQENTASFTVFPKTGTFKDFSSGKQGNAVSLIMSLESLNYPSALKFLAARYNIPIEEKEPTEEELARIRDRETLFSIIKMATLFFSKGATNHTYLQERGLSEKIAQEFQVGIAGDSWGAFSNKAMSEGFLPRDLLASGMSKKNENGGLYDFFRDRAIFPIQDWMGNIVGFGGRYLHEIAEGSRIPKYLNSSESPIYNKSKVLYGLYQAKQHIIKTDLCILTEGYTDVLAMHQASFKNTVATCGTALTPSQVKLIKRFTNNVLMLYDGDTAGIKSARKGLDLFLKEGMSVKILMLPDGMDPDDYLKEFSASQMQNTIQKHSLRWMDFIEGAMSKEVDLQKPEGKAQLVKAIEGKIKLMPDEVDRQLYLKSLEERFGISLNDTTPTPKNTSNFVDKPWTWDFYVSVCDKLGVTRNLDFEKNPDNSIQAKYNDIKGKPYRITAAGNTKIVASRKIGSKDRINAVYIPPQLRRLCSFDHKFLVICQREEVAWLLCHFRVPAVAIHTQLGFLSRPNKKEPHLLIKQVLREHDLNNIIYTIPHTAWLLPRVDDSAANNPYEEIDAASNAMEIVDTLSVLQQAFRMNPTEALHPRFDQPKLNYKSEYWLDNLLLENFYKYVDEDLFENPELVENILEGRNLIEGTKYFDRFTISSGTPFLFSERLFVQDPQKFFDFHGVAKLGKLFQLGKHIYEFDIKDSCVKQKEQSNQVFQVWKERGCYWAQAKGGGRQPRCDFSMRYVLEIKQEDSMILIEFIPMSGPSVMAVLSHSDILNTDAFKKKVADLEGGKFNYWGSKGELEQIHAMERKGVPDAISMEGVLGFEKRRKLYIWGNGILTPQGSFFPGNENGIVSIEDKKYYLPASASFNQEKESEYANELSFNYYEPNVDFKEYAQKIIDVHLMPGHMALCYIIASSFLDVAFKTMGKFPHFSLVASTSVGKSVIADTFSSLYGKLVQTNLRTRVTLPSFERKTKLFHNSIMILNEFNLNNKNVVKYGLEEYLVGCYDRQGGEKTVKNKSVQTTPNCSFFIIGQEGFYHREALVKRCIVQEMQKRVFGKEERDKLNDLNDISSDGVSGFHQQWWKHRDLIKQELRNVKDDIQGIIEDILDDPMVESRMTENWAIILAPICILLDRGLIEYPLTVGEIVDYAVECIRKQMAKMYEDGVLAIFFNFLLSNYGPRKTLNHQNVWLYRKKQELRLHMSSCLQAFTDYLGRNDHGIENISHQDFADRFKEHPSFIRIQKGIQVGYRTDGNGRIKFNPTTDLPEPNKSGAKTVVLDYKKLQEFSIPSIEWTAREPVDA